MTKILLALVLTLSVIVVHAQGDCANAAPFCTGTTYNFPAPVTGQNAQPGPDYGCLFSQPNPVWYYLQIANSGPIVMSISGAQMWDDIDFVAWGPFTSPTGPCTSQLTSNCSPSCPDNTSLPFPGFYPSGNMVDCSYDAQTSEICTIPNAVTGEWYLVMITNFGGNATNIIFTQTNTGSAGAGSTNCNILCNITSMTATPGACNSATNTFALTGTVSTYAPPSSGTLTISTSCGGSIVVNPPFNPTYSFSIPSVPATGGPCIVTASYSADPTCTFTLSINSPAPCNTPTVCNISQVTATPGACNTANNSYSLNGAVTFTNPPASGTLNITTSCGGSFTANPPFNSPVSFNFPSLTSNGSNCTVTAAFSASTSCTNTATYTAPAPCVTCTATASNSGAVCEGQTVSLSSSPAGGTQYSWSGPNSFSSSLQNPVLTNTTSQSAGVYTVTVTMPNGAVCSATTAVTIIPSPNANAGADLTICTGGSVTLNASGGTSYSWTPAGGLSNSSIANPVASPTTTTNYIVTVTQNGCVDSDTISVIVITNLVATSSNDTLICSGQSANLLAGGGSIFQWTPAISLSSAVVANPIATPTATTTYTVSVNANGCQPDTESVTVAVSPAVDITVSANDTVCAGDTGFVSVSGATSYLWMPGGSINDSLSAAPLTTQTYTVTGTTGPCSETETVAIVAVPLPVAVF